MDFSANLSRRTLDVCGLRSIAPGRVDFADAPAWEARGSYEPEPATLAQAGRLFDAAKGEPTFEQDELDIVMSEVWEAFFKTGKAGLLHYCRNHEQAVRVLTPEEKGEVVGCFLRRLQEEALKLAAAGDFPRLLRGLRIPPEAWPPRGEVPFGLLKRFTEDCGRLGRGFLVADPSAWWDAHEAGLPDFGK